MRLSLYVYPFLFKMTRFFYNDEDAFLWEKNRYYLAVDSDDESQKSTVNKIVEREWQWNKNVSKCCLLSQLRVLS
ncbi:hypothetical protein Chro_5915 (plasmid) [Chroococcidiopsis thermalis PCC 7203]|uniref:Uncharacterized protein n=1 Tax=Chroococcidiopsis thermalis (strain PCC 7203) TaxID=251229 RepID=K9U8V1_CHRTP|nr:hypothetical protein Chro_5915 [Chroococcidiopsis thermalis PCC 7203]